MASLAFDDLRAEAEAKYTDFTLEYKGEDLVLVSPVRLSSEKRGELEDLLNSLSSDERDESEGRVDELSVIKKIIEVIAKNAVTARKVNAAIGDDLPSALVLVQHYQDTVAMGEASDSPA